MSPCAFSSAAASTLRYKLCASEPALAFSVKRFQACIYREDVSSQQKTFSSSDSVRAATSRAHLRELCCSSHPVIRLRTTATSCAHLRELCCSSHPVLLSSCARSKAAARRAGPESKSTGCSRAPRPSELPSILGQARAVAAALKSALEQASLRRKPRKSSSFFSRQSAQSLRSSKGANSTHSCLRSSSSALGSLCTRILHSSSQSIN